MIKRDKGDIFRIQLTADVDIEFVAVPAGEFIMGAPKEVWPPRYSDAQPEHIVFLDGFWITKTPITIRHYEVFNSDRVFGRNKELPVHFITFAEANFFCTWLKEKSGHPVRLPTEAEWEKAARGTDGRPYPWGDEDPDTFFLLHERLHSVGRYPFAASPYGVQDICENIGEFVADYYDEKYYQTSPHSNPIGPSKGYWHVIRGKEMRTYARESEEDQINPRFGFRCVLPKLD